jgi:hypothetical protein
MPGPTHRIRRGHASHVRHCPGWHRQPWRTRKNIIIALSIQSPESGSRREPICVFSHSQIGFIKSDAVAPLLATYIASNVAGSVELALRDTRWIAPGGSHQASPAR